MAKTTTKTKKAAEPAAAGERSTIAAILATAKTRTIKLSQLTRHPDNRQPDPAAIDEIAASLPVHGMLEPPLVRVLTPTEGQIISGETRCRAAVKVWGGDRSIEVREIYCDDATALELLAIANAKRHDLTTVEKARLMARLHESGRTWEHVGEIYGMTGPAATNLCKILEAPAEWQAWLDKPLTFPNGEPKTLHQATVREVAKFASCPAALAAIESKYREATREWEWHSARDAQVTAVRSCVEHALRVTTERHTIYGDKGQWIGTEKLLFKLTPDLRTKLGIYLLPLGPKGEAVEVATNIKLYDKLQTEALQAKQKRRNSAAEPSKGGDRQSPAEAREKVKQQAEQLERRIKRWRYQWIKSLVAERLTRPENAASLTRVLTWMLIAPFNHQPLNAVEPECQMLASIGQSKQDVHGHIGHKAIWDLLKTIGPDDAQQAAVGFVQRLLDAHDPNLDWPLWPEELLCDLAVACGVDLADQWGLMQAGNERPERFAEFFGLHLADQLVALGKELGVYVAENAGKATAVKLLANASRVLPLPKSIEPLAEASAPKRRKGAAAWSNRPRTVPRAPLSEPALQPASRP